ncbi:hypothetical protein SEA_CASSEROLE_46 [Arthrobacter phage Casserole]|nr:hypothetical protein SEA_CASSEROLE_46 [Arthrobacter phage Casserole]
MDFKENDLVDELSRGVKTDVCKLCGAKIGDLDQHRQWHNKLDQTLKRLVQVSHGIR